MRTQPSQSAPVVKTEPKSGLAIQKSQGDSASQPLIAAPPGVSVVLMNQDDEEDYNGDLDMSPTQEHGCDITKSKLQAQLTNLLQIQEGFIVDVTLPSIMDPITAQIETLKIQLRSMRSPGRKLDGLRGVILRCEKRLSKAKCDLEEAESLLSEAKTRVDGETMALCEHCMELQLLEDELASQQSPLFRAVAQTQLPPEAWQVQQETMATQIAYLFGELDKAMKMAHEFAMTVTANELLSQQIAQLLSERQAAVTTLTTAGQQDLADMLDQTTPTLAAACTLEPKVEDGPDGLAPTPTLTPHQIPTPGGRVQINKLLSIGKLPTNRITGKLMVETLGFLPATAENRRAEASPYGDQ